MGIVKRLFSKAKHNETTGCMEWTGCCSGDGYGAFKIRGRQHGAHRLAFALMAGPLPPDMCVCHRCDNPVCINPAHLFVGSHQDNQQDKMAKGRSNLPTGEQHWTHWKPQRISRGERHGSSKIKDAHVDEIRSLYRSGALKQKAIASIYGISVSRVSQLVIGIKSNWHSSRECST